MPGETIKDVVVRIALQAVKTKIPVPDIKPAVQETDKLAKTVSEKFTQLENKVQESEKAVQDLAKAERKAAENARTVREETIKAGEALKTAGDGAFTLARGLAFVSASTEVDFQQALRTIAQVQGAFDIYRGLIDVTKGLSDARKALTAVTNVQTAAEGRLRNATLLTAAASKIAAFAGKLSVGALAAIGVAAGAATVAYVAYREELKKVEATEKRGLELDMQLEQARKRRIDQLLQEGRVRSGLASRAVEAQTARAQNAIQLAGLIDDPEERVRRLTQVQRLQFRGADTRGAFSRSLRERFRETEKIQDAALRSNALRDRASDVAKEIEKARSEEARVQALGQARRAALSERLGRLTSGLAETGPLVTELQVASARGGRLSVLENTQREQEEFTRQIESTNQELQANTRVMVDSLGTIKDSIVELATLSREIELELNNTE